MSAAPAGCVCTSGDLCVSHYLLETMRPKHTILLTHTGGFKVLFFFSYLLSRCALLDSRLNLDLAHFIQDQTDVHCFSPTRMDIEASIKKFANWNSDRKWRNDSCGS